MSEPKYCVLFFRWDYFPLENRNVDQNFFVLVIKHVEFIPDWSPMKATRTTKIIMLISMNPSCLQLKFHQATINYNHVTISGKFLSNCRVNQRSCPPFLLKVCTEGKPQSLGIRKISALHRKMRYGWTVVVPLLPPLEADRAKALSQASSFQEWH